MKLSIVTTLYNSSNFIEHFYGRAVSAAQTLTQEFEIIMVNDGSPDDSLEKAIALHRADTRVTVVDLSRNFGHHRAMMAGLLQAKGDLVFLIDSDLEEDPAVLSHFFAVIEAEKCDVVYGVQAKRRGGIFEVATGRAFYWLTSRLGGVKIPENVMTVRLMTSRYVRSLLLHREREMIISGLWAATGYHQVGVKVNKARGGHGSNYKFATKVRMLIDHITAYSSTLLYKVFYLGLLISIVSFSCMMYFVLNYLITGHALAGWTSIIASIWTFGGATILLIGLVGIYIGRIFNETKNRPYVIVRDVYRADCGEVEYASTMNSCSHNGLPERLSS